MNVECKCVCHVAGNQQHSDCCVITHLKARVAALFDIAMQTKAQWEAQRAMTIARLGGTVEGAPTHVWNFLQRIDELRETEARVASLDAALREIAKSEDINAIGAAARARIARAALAPRSERREGEPCPRCKGLRTVPSSVGVGPLNVPCPECACKRCGGEGIVWDHRNEMPCPACAPAAPKEEA